MRRFGYLALLGIAGMASFATAAAPQTLDKPGKKIRFLSLAEARAIALTQSTLGTRLIMPGIGLDSTQTPGDGNPISVLAGAKPRSKSIILTGVRRDPRPAELERTVNQTLLDVETAYWNLYGSYLQMYSREQGLRLSYETWKITEAQSRAGRVSRAAVAQAEGQYNLFRSQRLAALDTVLDNERQLRAMVGMAIKDGARLVPSDAPTLVEQKPDWKAASKKAWKKRPELYLAEQNLVRCIIAMPDKNVSKDNCEACPSAGRCSGVQPSPKSATCPSERELRVRRAFEVFQDQEEKADRYLGLWYRRISSAYFQIKAARAQREAFATQLKIRNELYRAGANEPGSGNPVTLSLLLEAQRFWAESLATECENIVLYNNSLAGWAYAQGEIMKYARVRLADNAPEGSEEVSAVEREHKRTRRHVRREPSVAAASSLAVLDAYDLDKAAPSLPALWKTYPLLKEVADVQTGLVEGRGVH